jgi:hypothetical protein
LTGLTSLPETPLTLEFPMKKFRTALLALTVALTVAGGTGAASTMDAKKGSGKSSITKTVNAKVKGGDSSWCC